MRTMKRDYVEGRLRPYDSEKRDKRLINRPEDLEITYVLDLEKCGVTKFQFDFPWSTVENRKASSRVMMTQCAHLIGWIKLSLNDVDELPEKCLEPFEKLLSFDASVNRIKRINGIQGLKFLSWIDLSHNLLMEVPDFSGCDGLNFINLSNNLIANISNLFRVPMLKTLDLSFNSLRSLLGIETQSRLEFLIIHHNQINSALPLVNCTRLIIADLSHNEIAEHSGLVGTFSQHKYLRKISLRGNPVRCEPSLEDDFRNNTFLVLLDEKNLRQAGGHVNYAEMDIRKKTELKAQITEEYRAHIEKRGAQTKFRVDYLKYRIRCLEEDNSTWTQSMEDQMTHQLAFIESLDTTNVTKYRQLLKFHHDSFALEPSKFF